MNATGIKITVSPLMPDVFPKLQVSGAVPMTDSARISMNLWLLAMFGTKPAVLRYQNGLIVSPATARLLEGAIGS